MSVDELQVLITANSSALQKEMSKANKSINSLQKSASTTATGITSAFKKLKTGIVALGIGKVIKDSIQMGMNAVESDSLFETSLGNMADSVRSWSNEVASALGLNAVAMRKNTGVIYNMTSSMGVAEENALKMSKGITLLAEDMASFYNLDSAEAFNKLRAGLTGETEPLKALGILVDENTVKQVAYSAGIAKTGDELTQQQKVLARYVAILKQTGNAQGDLARTLDSPANQLRLLKNQVRQMGLALSNFFLPVLQAILPYINAFARVITSAINGLAKFMGLKSTSASNETSKVSSNIGSIGDGLDDANKKAKALKGTMSSLDEFSTVQTETSSSSSSGTSVGGGLDFDLSEYDAHLDWIDGKTDKIAKHIENSFKKVGNVLNTVWNSAPVQAFLGTISSGFEFTFNYVSTIGENLRLNLQTTWSNIQGDVSLALTNMSAYWTTFWTDLQIGIETWGQPIIDGMSGLFNSIWTDAIDPALQVISKGWADFSGILLELWNEHGQPLINNIGEFVTKTIDLFQSIWDNVLEPIITPFLEMLSWLWDSHLKGLVEKVGDFVLSLINGALEIYNGFIQPLITWVLEFLSPIWSFLSNVVIGNLGSILAFVSDTIGSIIGVFTGIIDFITGVFTRNWKKAWNGVKSIFKNIVDGLVGVFKLPLNLIIDAINGFIAGVNKIKLPDWDILGSFAGKGFNIPKIPKLARGGVVSRATYAMIGENGDEAVMPLEHNTGWIDRLADRLADKINGTRSTVEKLDISGKLTVDGNDLVYVYDNNKKDRGYDGKDNPSFAY